MKDRLYTTGPKSLARRSAQTALHQITHAMLRWMAPFLSFTAEEAWKIFGNSDSIFLETYCDLPPVDISLLAKWEFIQNIRDGVNKRIEAERQEGRIGSSLQANVEITAGPADALILLSIGIDLKYVLIVSSVVLHTEPAIVDPDDFETAFKVASGEISFKVKPSSATKCERCWHYRDDVGVEPAHPTICGRCTSNLFGTGEVRKFA